MLYNLTCLDLWLEDKDQALEDLERALENGYTNFRLMENDRDLNLLRDDPRFTEMVDRFENEFRQEFQAHALPAHPNVSRTKIQSRASREIRLH